MGSAAPPSPPSSSAQLGSERTGPPAPEPPVDWDFFIQRRFGSMDDLMGRTRVVREYSCYANLLCKTCGSGDRDDELLLCDGCDRGHHTTCLRPIVAQVPVGPWFCPVCAPPPAEEPDINYFVPDEPKLKDVCEDISMVSTPIVDTTIEASNERETGSSTIKKRNGKKTKRIHGDLGPHKKNLKVDDDSIDFWDESLAKRAFQKGFKIEGEIQSPPFIEICGFYITYDEFYDSFKARGLVANSVMDLWSNEFNFDQRQKFEDRKTSDRKFAFSQLVTGYLSDDSASFDHEKTCKKIYTKINNKFPFINMDLMFFPMIVKNHWVLLCVSMSMKQIAFFDSLSASKATTSLRCDNLISNFAATTMKYGFLKENVSDFERRFPSGYPKQNNLFDCGMYIMDYMDAWNGKEMVSSSLEKGTVLEYRKHAALLLLESARNMVKLDDFVKKYNGKET